MLVSGSAGHLEFYSVLGFGWVKPRVSSFPRPPGRVSVLSHPHCPQLLVCEIVIHILCLFFFFLFTFFTSIHNSCLYTAVLTPLPTLSVTSIFLQLIVDIVLLFFYFAHGIFSHVYINVFGHSVIWKESQSPWPACDFLTKPCILGWVAEPLTGLFLPVPSPGSALVQALPPPPSESSWGHLTPPLGRAVSWWCSEVSAPSLMNACPSRCVATVLVKKALFDSYKKHKCDWRADFNK